MRRDPIAVVEACYDLRSSEEDWLRGIATALQPLTRTQKHGLIAYHVSLGADHGVCIQNPVQVGGAVDVASRIREMGDLLERLHAGQASALEKLQAKIYQRVVRAGLRAPVDHMLMTEFDKIGPDWMYTLGVAGVRDHFALINHHIDGLGATLFVGGLSERDGLTPAARCMHHMLGAHIKAGLRLRRRTKGEPLAIRPPEGGAVLDASGGVVHAEGEAAVGEVPGELVNAAREIDRARTQQGRDEVALEVWQGLAQGRWSLVERFDTDGQRFILAHRNEENVRDPRGLSRMESRVVGLAVRGYSNKLIAYHLGVSESTAGSHLNRAMAKLGISSRVELVKLLGRHYPQNTDPRFPV